MSVQTEINRINNEVTSQADLIAQIQTALENKAAVSASGEVSITENGVHDVKQYATANVDVQSAPVLLWTNASPTSNWSNQTIALNGEGYDAYLLKLVGYNANQNNYSIVYLPIDNTAHWLAALQEENGSYFGSTRQFTASNSSIVTASGALTQCIPVKIWGVNFTL